MREDVGTLSGIEKGGIEQLGEAMEEALEIPRPVGLDEAVINWIKSIEMDAQVAADAYCDGRGGFVLSGNAHT